MSPEEFLALTGHHPAAQAFLDRSPATIAQPVDPATTAIPMQALAPYLENGVLTVPPPPPPDDER